MLLGELPFEVKLLGKDTIHNVLGLKRKRRRDDLEDTHIAGNSIGVFDTSGELSGSVTDNTVANDVNVEGDKHFTRDDPRCIEDDVINVAAGEDRKRTLMHVHNRVVRTADLVGDVVVEDTDVQEITLLLAFLKELDVSGVEHVPNAIDVNNACTGLWDLVVGELNETASGRHEGGASNERTMTTRINTSALGKGRGIAFSSLLLLGLFGSSVSSTGNTSSKLLRVGAIGDVVLTSHNEHAADKVSGRDTLSALYRHVAASLLCRSEDISTIS